MALSLSAVKRMIIALGAKAQGNELASAVDTASALAAQSASSEAAVIVATSTSTTTNFGALKVGDKVIHIPATAGNAEFFAVVTAGTLPAAAVVGDLYIALRAFSAPAARNEKL